VLKGRSTRKFILPAFFLFALFLLASCGDQSTFDAKGVVAKRQLELFWIIFGLAVLVFVVVEGALIYSAFRFRRKPGQGIPKQTHGHNKLEIAWTIAPGLVLIGIAIPTLIVIFNTSASGGVDFSRRVVQEVTNPETEITLVDAGRFKDEAVLGQLIAIPRVEVTVRAHQWWWEFRYPDFGIETANELRVPANTRIDLKLESDDVIHSFWIPNLMGKTDIIPRSVNETWFVADEPGIYKGLCAEFCGISHTNMRFRVIVQTQSDFEEWKMGYHANKTAEATGEAALGQILFGNKGCVLCHSKDGPTSLEARESQREAFFRGDPVVPGPNLTQFATRTTLAAGILPLTVSNLTAWIRNPEDLKPGNRMVEKAAVYNDPALALTNDEVEALAAYLLTLHTPAEAVSTPTPIPPIGATPTPTPSLAEPTPEPSTPTPLTLPPGDPAAGEQVFATASPLTCSTCHSIDGTSGLGPSLQGIGTTAGARVPGLSAGEYITQSIIDPDAFVVDGFPSGLMPQTFRESLTDQQLADVISYLLTIE